MNNYEELRRKILPLINMDLVRQNEEDKRKEDIERKKGRKEEMQEYGNEIFRQTHEADIERDFLTDKIDSTEYVSRKRTLRQSLEILSRKKGEL